MKKTNIKKPKFRFILGFVCGALIFGSIGAFANSTFTQITAVLKPDLPLYINGEKVNLENGAIFYKDTNYLSLREVAEINGYKVDFDHKTQNIDLVGGVVHDDYGNSDSSSDSNGSNNDKNTNNNEKDDENLSDSNNFAYEDKGTSKLLSTGKNNFIMDVFDFNFIEPTDDTLELDNKIELVMEYKVNIFIPNDHGKDFTLPLFLYSIDTAEGSDFIPFAQAKTIEGKSIEINKNNTFQFKHHIYSTNKPTKFFISFTNVYGEHVEPVEWIISN